jgi:plastocyanin
VTAAALLAVVALATPASYRISEVAHYGVPEHHHKTKRACVRHGDRRCRKHVPRWGKVRVPAPLPPSPGPVPAPTPTPPGPVPLPKRTSVDLDEWRVSPAYRTLAAGQVEFNAANLGEDDHDFSIRRDATPLRSVFLAPGESASVRVTLAAGEYTLYCSLPSHEGYGMRAKVAVR